MEDGSANRIREVLFGEFAKLDLRRQLVVPFLQIPYDALDCVLVEITGCEMHLEYVATEQRYLDHLCLHHCQDKVNWQCPGQLLKPGDPTMYTHIRRQRTCDLRRARSTMLLISDQRQPSEAIYDPQSECPRK